MIHDNDGDCCCCFTDDVSRFVQRGSLWDMLRRAQADPSLLPWSRRLKFAAEVLYHRSAFAASALPEL